MYTPIERRGKRKKIENAQVITLNLDVETIRKARELGKGSASAGVRMSVYYIYNAVTATQKAMIPLEKRPKKRRPLKYSSMRKSDL